MTWWRAPSGSRRARRAVTPGAVLGPSLWRLPSWPSGLAADPPNCAPVQDEGDLWGDQKTRRGERPAAFRRAGRDPIPNPFPREGAMPTPRPPVGGSEEVRAKGGSGTAEHRT
jgi:hypothetical protein